ncbi:unnamed protein product [Haemonchus placei]|uniref:2-Hacid_dh domain-containing protein n=1 Tax=Haemonchus placei TaxID=6290 RepID=A0A0N4WGT0_HAEPC|nr:unnamed protein product [Haemonchus placei]
MILRMGTVASVEAVFKGAPDAVAITRSICDFNHNDSMENEIVMASALANVTCVSVSNAVSSTLSTINSAEDDRLSYRLTFTTRP